MALSAAGDVAIPELMEAEEVMEDAPVAAFHLDRWASNGAGRARLRRWRTEWGRELVPTPPRSPERDASPREEVVHAPASFQRASAHHGPPAHLWTSRPTSTSSATTTTPAATEEGDDHVIDGRF
ncbi:hypothetical protein D1007_62321 [Hordeum vulgare]|nr:hypothetical protein D1007_62321 [Hordeum vulgare]